MSDSPEAVVRRLSALLGRPVEQMESGLRELLDPEVEWVNPPDAVEGGLRKGIDGFMTAVGNMQSGLGTGATYDVDTLTERGEYVIVGGLMHSGGTSSGAEAGMRTHAVVRVVDGRIIRFQWFFQQQPAEELFEAVTGAG